MRRGGADRFLPLARVLNKELPVFFISPKTLLPFCLLAVFLLGGCAADRPEDPNVIVAGGGSRASTCCCPSQPCVQKTKCCCGTARHQLTLCSTIRVLPAEPTRVATNVPTNVNGFCSVCGKPWGDCPVQCNGKNCAGPASSSAKSAQASVNRGERCGVCGGYHNFPQPQPNW